MTVNFQTKKGYVDPFVSYRLAPEDDVQGDVFLEVDVVRSLQLDQHRDKRWVHSVELTNLNPGEKYEFKIVLDSETETESEFYKFRTIPSDPDATIRFINGGDMDVGGDTEALLKLAKMKDQIYDLDPMFALIGGDFVYESRIPLAKAIEAEWDDWFKNWQTHMTTSEGCLVPLVAVLGDHEMDSRNPYAEGVDEVEFFLDFFDQDPGEDELPYFARTFGPNLVIYVLDSGNAISHADQRDWLRAQLTDHTDIPHQFAAYHHPFYSAAKADDFDEDWARLGREEWAPLFDEFGLDTAFEHDGHVFKTTPRLRAGVPDPSGTWYIGEGAFGRKLNSLPETLPTYIEFAEERKHFWSVVVDAVGESYAAIDIEGEVFFEYPPPPAGP